MPAKLAYLSLSQWAAMQEQVSEIYVNLFLFFIGIRCCVCASNSVAAVYLHQRWIRKRKLLAIHKCTHARANTVMYVMYRNEYTIAELVSRYRANKLWQSLRVCYLFGENLLSSFSTTTAGWLSGCFYCNCWLHCKLFGVGGFFVVGAVVIGCVIGGGGGGWLEIY